MVHVWEVNRYRPIHYAISSISPVYFEFAPEDLMRVGLAYPDQIIGGYDSHPTGFATASGTDRRTMQHVHITTSRTPCYCLLRACRKIMTYTRPKAQRVAIVAQIRYNVR